MTPLDVFNDFMLYIIIYFEKNFLFKKILDIAH